MSKIIAVRFTESFKKRIIAEAEKEDLFPSELIRKIVKEYFKDKM